MGGGGGRLQVVRAAPGPQEATGPQEAAGRQGRHDLEDECSGAHGLQGSLGEKKGQNTIIFQLLFSITRSTLKIPLVLEFGVWGHEPPVLLAGPCSKPFSAPDSNVLVCFASLCVRHTHLSSVTVVKERSNYGISCSSAVKNTMKS